MAVAEVVSYPHIEKRPGQSARLKSHPRTRVAMIVMDYLAHNWSVDEICQQYPYLNLAETHAAMVYYFDHQEEIDAEIRAELEEVDRERAAARPTPIELKLRAKGLI